MPSTLNAPGIYIEELPSGVHPIAGVSTSDTAFVDWFPRGPATGRPGSRASTSTRGVFGGLTPRARRATAFCSTSSTAEPWHGSSGSPDPGDTPATLDVKDGDGRRGEEGAGHLRRQSRQVGQLGRSSR